MRLGLRLLLGFEEGQAATDLLRGVKAADPSGDGAGDDRRRQFRRRRQQPRAVRGGPFAGLVELADDARPDILAPVVELFLELVFDDLALLLDHQDFFQALGKMAHAVGLQRPGHADLVQAQADLAGLAFVDAQIVERLAHIEISLAAGDDAQPRRRGGIVRAQDQMVEPVHPGISQRRIDLELLHAQFLRQLRIGPADMNAVTRQDEVLRQADAHALRVGLHRGRTLRRVGGDLHRHPTAGIARHGPAVHAQVEHVLEVGRRQHRHAASGKNMLTLMRDGGRPGAVVVAGDHQHAAMLGGAGVVGVLEDVAAAVDPGPLAVPHREYAVALRAGKQVELLRAPDGGRRQFLIDPGMEADVLAAQERPGLMQGGVQSAQGRAAVTRDIAGAVDAGGDIAPVLQHGQQGQGLDPAQEDAAALLPVLVVEGYFGQGHVGFQPLVGLHPFRCLH